MSNQNESQLTLKYDLFDLPTAQHKAGLAGLLLMTESMVRRRLPNTPVVQSLTPTTATIVVSEESLQALFDDLYAAAWVERESKAKWANKKPKRIVKLEVATESGKPKTEKLYIYDMVVPSGGFL